MMNVIKMIAAIGYYICDVITISSNWLYRIWSRMKRAIGFEWNYSTEVHVKICWYSYKYNQFTILLILMFEIKVKIMYVISSCNQIRLINLPNDEKSPFVPNYIFIYVFLNEILLWARLIQPSQEAVSLFVIGWCWYKGRGLFLLFSGSCGTR